MYLLTLLLCIFAIFCRAFPTGQLLSCDTLMLSQVWVDIKFAGAVYNSEQFNTAGRSIGTGLLAVDIVSHWTWASILLQSVSYGYFYGITGSYWCGKQPRACALSPQSLLSPY